MGTGHPSDPINPLAVAQHEVEGNRHSDVTR